MEDSPKPVDSGEDQKEVATVEEEIEEEEDDATLIRKAEEAAGEELLLKAARLLKRVKNQVLTPEHNEIIRWADRTEESMKVLLESPDAQNSSWTRQSESHGDRDFFVYYQVEKSSNQLFCRIESAVEESLLIPVVSVFNESDLYKTWMPSWERPFKLGYKETKMLKESGRGNQIIQVTVNTPRLISPRETVFHAVAVDAIEESGAIAIQVNTETPEDDPVIPEPLPGVVRVDFENSLLIRGCPHDHPCYPKSTDQKYPPGDEVFLISMKMAMDAHVAGVPTSLINFATRTVIGTMWAKLLHVAEHIRDGTMESHVDAIARKKELYDWIEKRLKVMVETLKEDSQHPVPVEGVP
eukprot:scaffold918_cov126-Cylindrotheca_fusiformis.AAC.21